MPETVLGQPTMSAGVRSTQSLPTASLVKNLEDDSWTDTHIWYDTKARPIGSFTKNHLGGSTVTEKQLDYSGAVLAVNTFHQRLSSDAQVAVRERFEYDSQFRLLKQYHQVNTNPEVLMAEYAYNELGQVANKKVGNNLQQIDYAYNIRGWVTKVNNPAQLNTDLFGYEVGFTDSSSPLITEGNFNGNITEVSWKSAADNVLKRYSYQYDGYNRLLKGNYQEPETTVPQNEYFSEEMSYDRNGNIMTLQRNSKSMAGSFAEQIDDLVYNYDGNRLTSVNELKQNYLGYPDVSGQPIAYDANGSMKDHQDKGILNIDYNILNLPRTIIYNQLYSVRLYVGGPEEERNVTTRYYYRADGTKLKKAYIRGFKYGIERTTTTEYLDGFQYESITTSQTLQFVPTPEGYYSFQNNQYIYQYKDHLGNVRVSFFSDNGSPSIIEENNYYPIGMAHNNTHISNTYTYQYNGKELQLENGMYDYGARMYMPDIGRWGVVDPLTEVTPHLSPYHYGNNNPIMYNDPTGLLSQMFMDELHNSPDGTTWTNSGNGYFYNNWGGMMTGNGAAMNYTSYAPQPQIASLACNIPGSGGEGGGSSFVSALNVLYQSSQSGGSVFTSQADLENYINQNIGPLSLIEGYLRTNILLATNRNLRQLQKRYNNESQWIYEILKDGTMWKTNFNSEVGGVTTTPDENGMTTIYISPKAKSMYAFPNYVNSSNMTIVHEILHAYHWSIGLNMNYSESAAYTYNVAYHKYYGNVGAANYYREELKFLKYQGHPSSFYWMNLPSFINTGLPR